MKTLRESTWYVRVALLLTGVWAVWLFAFVVWASNTEELKTENNLYMDFLVFSVMAFIGVAVGLALRRIHRWGDIAGGLVVTLVAVLGCNASVSALRNWGEIRIGTASGRSMSSPWVPLDSLSTLPYWVLLVAGVLLLIDGIAHVVRSRHGSTPHVGAAA